MCGIHVLALHIHRGLVVLNLEFTQTLEPAEGVWTVWWRRRILRVLSQWSISRRIFSNSTEFYIQSDDQEHIYYKTKFPSNLNCERKIFVENKFVSVLYTG